jgi:hypothetical protein
MAALQAGPLVQLLTHTAEGMLGTKGTGCIMRAK